MNSFKPTDHPIGVAISDGFLHVTLHDQRIISTPLTWYPRLLRATPAQLAHTELSIGGVHWPDIDEDLSVEGMLLGSPAHDYQSSDGSP